MADTSATSIALIGLIPALMAAFAGVLFDGIPRVVLVVLLILITFSIEVWAGIRYSSQQR